MTNNSSNDSLENELKLNQCLVSYIVTSLSKTYEDNIMAACIVNTIFLLLGSSLNLLVIVVFILSKQLRSKVTFFPVFVLCTVDFFTVTTVHPLFLTQAIAELLETPKCSFKVAYFSTLYIFPGMSASTLMLMNIERYITIVKPLYHLQISNKRQKFLCACVLCWLLMAGNLACRLNKPSYSKGFTMVGISIACFITLFTYSSIFYTARKRRHTTLSGEASESSTQERSQNTKLKFLRELKIAKSYLFVIFLSFVCYLPTAVVVFATRYPWHANEERRTLLALLYTWTNTFITISSTLNCLVFFWANAGLRKEAWKLWKRCMTSTNVN